MANKVLILGGYGNFGKYIAKQLLKSNIPIILAGRRAHLLDIQKQKCLEKYKNSSVQTTVMDINNDIRQYLTQTKPKVVLNTCGPFQLANYKVVQNCIQSKVNYIDLADGRQFVKGMSKLHQKAVQNNVTVITGASSVPGLSSAVIQQYKPLFKQIDKVEYGISPGQRTNRGGQATIKGVMGYIGKPIPPFGDFTNPIYGWQNLYAQKYPQLGYRLMGNCEVPDLDIFPQKYGIKTLKFSAGTQNKFLHLGVYLTSWLVRLGIPLNLQNHSSFLLKFSHTVFDSLGTDEGGMHMKITGRNLNNDLMQVRWFIIVRKGDGPNVPIIPVIHFTKKMYETDYSLPGVHPCVGLISLKEYLQEMKEFSFSTYQQKEIIKS